MSRCRQNKRTATAGEKAVHAGRTVIKENKTTLGPSKTKPSLGTHESGDKNDKNNRNEKNDVDDEHDKHDANRQNDLSNKDKTDDEKKKNDITKRSRNVKSILKTATEHKRRKPNNQLREERAPVFAPQSDSTIFLS